MSRKRKSIEKRTFCSYASTDFNVQVGLDNKALRSKNYDLTQAVTKLQRENARKLNELILSQEENWKITSEYNNLINVISTIDSNMKSCLPILQEIVENATHVIQLCPVALNISSTNTENGTNRELQDTVTGFLILEI